MGTSGTLAPAGLQKVLKIHELVGETRLLPLLAWSALFGLAGNIWQTPQQVRG